MQRIAEARSLLRLPASFAGLSCVLALVFGKLARWQESHRQRYALQALDDRLLKDIGLSRADVHRESAKPFWQD